MRDMYKRIMKKKFPRWKRGHHFHQTFDRDCYHLHTTPAEHRRIVDGSGNIVAWIDDDVPDEIVRIMWRAPEYHRAQTERIQHCKDPTLDAAAVELELALRWWMHMWATRNNEARWINYGSWRDKIDSDCMRWRKAYPVQVWGFSRSFWASIVLSVVFLADRWWGMALKPSRARRIIRLIRVSEGEGSP